MSDLNLKKTVSKNSTQSFNEYYQEDYDYEFEEGDLNNQITDENTVFIEEKNIMKEREKMIQEAMEKLFLERPQAILAMIYLEWNIDKLDNWYEDVDQNRYKEEDLINAFRIFDKEGNGKISIKELRYVMMSSGVDFNENYIKDIINESNVDNDEFIDYHKFIKLLIDSK